MSPQYRPREEPPVKGLSGFVGKLGRGVKKHAGWVATAVGLVIGAVGLYVALSADTPLSVEQQELVANIPPKVGWRCQPVGLDEITAPAYVRLAEAMMECESVDPGPESVLFTSFTTEANQRAYIRSLAARSFREGFDCKADYLPEGRWTDASGNARGEVVCADGPKHANVVWSDTSNRVHLVGKAIARLADEEALHHWWQRDVKYDGDEIPSKPRKQLAALLPRGFGRCYPSRIILPSAQAALTCIPRHGISSAGADLFASRHALKQYIETQAKSYPGATHREGCQRSTYSYTDWWLGNDKGHPQGKLLCYVFDGTQWFMWSTNHPRVYAYAGRADGKWHKLWLAWAHSLSHIGRANHKKGQLHARSISSHSESVKHAPLYQMTVPIPHGVQGPETAGSAGGTLQAEPQSPGENP
jgi:hypothetical protein